MSVVKVLVPPLPSSDSSCALNGIKPRNDGTRATIQAVFDDAATSYSNSSHVNRVFEFDLCWFGIGELDNG